MQAFVQLFGGSEGNLCLGLPIVRFDRDIQFTGADGAATRRPDLTQLPQIGAFAPGSTWNFQFWFRDIDPYFTSNTTDAVTLSQPSTEDIAVPFTVGGTATADVDYHFESPNPLLIAAGQSSAGLVISVAEDGQTESDETVILRLQDPTNAVLGTASEFTLTIVDDD
ncbi:MAG: hypothetical protein GY711_24805 [bacterium]|nr:hypothetical protein [bacterium]